MGMITQCVHKVPVTERCEDCYAEFQNSRSRKLAGTEEPQAAGAVPFEDARREVELLCSHNVPQSVPCSDCVSAYGPHRRDMEAGAPEKLASVMRGEAILVGQYITPASFKAREVGIGPIDHPSHYNTGSIEPIDVIDDWSLGFHTGNAVKHIARAKHKGSELKNLKRARWYLTDLIERMETSR